MPEASRAISERLYTSVQANPRENASRFSVPNKPFIWTIRVYYEDTDTCGIVYYANYLKFFERARTEWLRSVGFEQQKMADELGLRFVIASVECDFKLPARLDDVIELDVRVARLGSASMVFEQSATARGCRVGSRAGAGRMHRNEDVHSRTVARRPAGCGRTTPPTSRMTPTADLSILSLITQATLVVQIVMLLLAFLSIASWTAIFQKQFSIKRAKRETNDFEKQFWGGADLSRLYEIASNPRRKAGAEERIFEAGMSEYLKLRVARTATSEDRPAMLDGARRAMRAAYQREMDALEARLNFLASVGSVSPYIGLFGTVWGIMHAFTGLSNLQQANLASVAPGIAEALVATAIGLFAAIPAVVAYNRFANDIDRLANRFESFMEEFLNILQRHKHSA